MPNRTYSDWRQGSSGTLDPARTEYNSVNAQIYENGTLGVRPGWKLYSLTDGTKVFVDTTDQIRSLVWYRESDADERLALVFDDAGTQKYDVLNLDTTTWASGGSVDNTADTTFIDDDEFRDPWKIPTWNDGFILTSIGAYLSIANSTTIGTPTSINTADGYAAAASIYRERAYYWGFAGKPGRVYYSDAGDYTTVGATSFFDVNIAVSTYAGAVTGMWAIKNALVIVRKDHRWLVLTGTSPENGSLREMGHDVTPDFNTATVVDNQLYFLSPTAQGVIVATPSFVDSQELGFLAVKAIPASTAKRPDVGFTPHPAVGDEVTRSLFLPGSDSYSSSNVIHAVERVNDVFNLSRWISDMQDACYFTNGLSGVMWCVLDRSDNTWGFYSRDYTLNRPGKSDDTRSVALTLEPAAGADGDRAVVDLGEQRAAQGTVIRPTKVILDIDYWKGGNYSDPILKIDATIFGTGLTNDATPEDTLTQEVQDMVAVWGDTPGDLPYKRRVAVVLPHGQFGTRFRIRVTYDNIALDVVDVYYEEQNDTR